MFQYLYILFLFPVALKYRYAKQWGSVHCVSAKWFHDSVDAGYCLDEGDYDVDKEGMAGGGASETGDGTSRKRYVKINTCAWTCRKMVGTRNFMYSASCCNL